MLRCFCVSVLSLAVATAALAQTPQPFPRPNTPPAKPAQPAAPPAPAPAQPPAPKAPTAPQALPPAATNAGAPTEAQLGAPIYPSAVFLSSYEAGKGQRFFIYGVNAAYAEMVNYYRTVLKTKGDELFEAPPTHFFETARFREETMAFAPSVTIKDYTYGGSAGYPNPKKGSAPERFPTIIQIVPQPR